MSDTFYSNEAQDELERICEEKAKEINLLKSDLMLANQEVKIARLKLKYILLSLKQQLSKCVITPQILQIQQLIKDEQDEQSRET